MVRRLLRKAKYYLAKKIAFMLKDVEYLIANETLPNFANKPKNLNIELPRRIFGADKITLGDNINLGPNCLLIAIKQYPGPSMCAPSDTSIEYFQPKIVIGDGVVSTGGLQIGAHDEIVIEDNVLFASNVMLSDGFHGYQSALVPYKYQRIEQIKPIRIKKGCWIGQNVVVGPGVVIGENTIIGANSVVLFSIPDRCIAVGSPAKIIKRWNNETGQWEKDFCKSDK